MSSTLPRYIPHTAEDVRHMLDAIGVADLDALFASVPEKLRLRRPLAVPEAVSEQEIAAELAALAARNAHAGSHPSFLGAGIYAHYVPTAVDALVSRAEFTTSYTPYQPEISQGTLQAIFEWQTMICGLTGLDVSNASLYDGASATAEAVLMAIRATRRRRVVLAHGLHPHYADVLRTYVRALDVEIASVPRAADGRTAAVDASVDGDTACVVLQQPGFLGTVQDVAAVAAAAHAQGAMLIVVVNEALSMGMLRAPGELGADIVCGEAQSFGVASSFGGPALGFLATREKFVRQLPGRVCGETVDGHGQRGFVLTLSTREQHIRREKATSNICTNQGLLATRATIYLSLLGESGFTELGRVCHERARKLAAMVASCEGYSLAYQAPYFREFVVACPSDAVKIAEAARRDG
ncbi:MAG: aminomethyl-transferring glycine dehydrogenase subunit GcvPA, partial [Myxococcota bacterium]|nr:aminomethyl-transferring glycine dehydrogenase subunit GcvPA [Myxococcota bacterium]